MHGKQDVQRALGRALQHGAGLDAVEDGSERDGPRPRSAARSTRVGPLRSQVAQASRPAARDGVRRGGRRSTRQCTSRFAPCRRHLTAATPSVSRRRFQGIATSRHERRSKRASQSCASVSGNGGSSSSMVCISPVPRAIAHA